MFVNAVDVCWCWHWRRPFFVHCSFVQGTNLSLLAAAHSAASPSSPSNEPADSPYGSKDEGTPASSYISTLAFYSPANSPSLASPTINRKRFNTLDAYYCSLSRSPLGPYASSPSLPGSSNSSSSSTANSTSNSSSNSNSNPNSNPSSANSAPESESSTSKSGHRSDPDYFDIGLLEALWSYAFPRNWPFQKKYAGKSSIWIDWKRIVDGSLEGSLPLSTNAFSLKWF